jgi:hypothetical protein
MLVDVVNGCDKLVGQLTVLLEISRLIIQCTYLIHSILKLRQDISHGYNASEVVELKWLSSGT